MKNLHKGQKVFIINLMSNNICFSLERGTITKIFSKSALVHLCWWSGCGPTRYYPFHRIFTRRDNAIRSIRRGSWKRKSHPRPQVWYEGNGEC
jgi:hypothetical protein